MNFPDNLKYTKSHEWIVAQGTTLACGITDFAQKEISDVVFAEAPKPGRKVKQGEACAVVESVKAAFDIYAPISGEIVEGNKSIESDPAVINEDPYGKGWLFKIKPANPGELSTLMDSAAYEKHTETSAH